MLWNGSPGGVYPTPQESRWSQLLLISRGSRRKNCHSLESSAKIWEFAPSVSLLISAWANRQKTKMTVPPNHWRTETSRPHSRTVADYVYQGAAILAALLVVLSATV